MVKTVNEHGQTLQRVEMFEELRKTGCRSTCKWNAVAKSVPKRELLCQHLTCIVRCLCAAMFASKVLPRHRSGAVQFPRATPLNRKGEGPARSRYFISPINCELDIYPVVFTLYSGVNSPPTWHTSLAGFILPNISGQITVWRRISLRFLPTTWCGS